MVASKLRVLLTLLTFSAPQTQAFGWRADKRAAIGKDSQAWHPCAQNADHDPFQQAQDQQRPYKNNQIAIYIPSPSQNFKSSSHNRSATASPPVCSSTTANSSTARMRQQFLRTAADRCEILSTPTLPVLRFATWREGVSRSLQSAPSSERRLSAKSPFAVPARLNFM